MAIRVRGTIIISRKTGRRGAFNIGDLRTEIGNFEVKDALIEEYEEGSYTGYFFIKWIEPESRAWGGRVFVKVRAELDEMLIDDVDQTTTVEPQLPPDADPVDDESTPADPPAPAAPRQRRSPTKANIPADTASTDQALFGEELYALLTQRQPIKLDPTVDRIAFRTQRDRLKDLDYGFDAKSQTWSVRER